MAQERIDIEGTRWLPELPAMLGGELVDVRFVAEGEGFDFLLVHSHGSRSAAIERFTEAFTRAPDIPPFEIMCFEQGHVPDYYAEYLSIGTAPSHAR